MELQKNWNRTWSLTAAWLEQEHTETEKKNECPKEYGPLPCYSFFAVPAWAMENPKASVLAFINWFVAICWVLWEIVIFLLFAEKCHTGPCCMGTLFIRSLDLWRWLISGMPHNGIIIFFLPVFVKWKEKKTKHRRFGLNVKLDIWKISSLRSWVLSDNKISEL